MRYDAFPILNPSTAGNADVHATLGTTTSSAAIELDRNSLYLLSTDLPCNLRRGAAGIDAATASDLRLPAGVWQLDTGKSYEYIRIFNPDGASSLHYWIASCSAT